LTFLQAAAFQWVNPQARAMALTAATTYTPEGEPIRVVLGSEGMRRFRARPGTRRPFDLPRPARLAVSLYPLGVETRPAGASKEAPRVLAGLPATPRWSSRG